MPMRVWSLRAVGPRDAADFGDDGERRAHRALGRVLERLRKAEIGQHAVAHEFGDEAAKRPIAPAAAF